MNNDDGIERPRRGRGFQFLSDEHLRYIIVRYHIEKVRPGQIYEELTDPESLIKYKIRPIPGLTLKYLYRRISRIPNTTVEIVKQEWCNALLDETFAIKRCRIKELTKLYKRTKNIEQKRKILHDIKDEVGEEAWRAAIKESGPKINVTLAEEMKEFFTEKE